MSNDKPLSEHLKDLEAWLSERGLSMDVESDPYDGYHWYLHRGLPWRPSESISIYGYIGHAGSRHETD